jgi:hypothetical protein
MFGDRSWCGWRSLALQRLLGRTPNCRSACPVEHRHEPNRPTRCSVSYGPAFHDTRVPRYSGATVGHCADPCRLSPQLREQSDVETDWHQNWIAFKSWPPTPLERPRSRRRCVPPPGGRSTWSDQLITVHVGSRGWSRESRVRLRGPNRASEPSSPSVLSHDERTRGGLTARRRRAERERSSTAPSF